MVDDHNDLMRSAYTAGILDGEGSISMTRVSSAKKGPYWRVVISVSNCDLPLIALLREWWGGSILVGINKGPNKRPQHRWTVVGTALDNVLRAIRPYLVIKTDRAAWASEFRMIQASLREGGGRYSDSAKNRISELRSLFDQDRSRSLSARNRTWNGE